MYYIPDYAKNVLDIFEASGFKAYLVGGCVRDLLMGKTPHDYDITTDALPCDTMEIFNQRGFSTIPIGLKHGTVAVISDGNQLEVTTFRLESSYTDNRHPDAVTFTNKLSEDLSRRDFTVNAITYDGNELIDLFDGIQHIEQKLIKCVGEPDNRFNEDGLRILRALRFASVLGFSIDAETSESIHRNRELLKNISAERIRSEFFKLICGPHAELILREYLDVINVFAPEIKSVPNLKGDLYVHLAQLFADAESAVNALRRLKSDNKTLRNVRGLLEFNGDIFTDSLPRVIMKLRGNYEQVKRLAVLKDAPKSIFAELKRLEDTNVCISLRGLAVKGNDLLAAGFAGYKFKVILQRLLDDVVDGKVKNNKAALLRLATHYFKPRI